MKRSIQIKIQNSMFLASILTLLTLSVVIVILFNIILKPVTYYMTKSTEMDFVKKYASTSILSDKKDDFRKAFTMDTSIDEVLKVIDDSNEKDNVLPHEMSIVLEDTSESTVVINSENDIKRLLILSNDVYLTSNEILKKHIANVDLIHVNVNVNGYVLELPKVVVSEDKKINQIITDSTRKITVLDQNGENVGFIKIYIEPSLIMGLFAVYIVLLTVVSLFSIFIVKMVSRVLSKGIVRPIDQVNKQLSLMTTHEAEEVSNFKLMLKKPPKEIKVMIENTNLIITQFKTFSDLLENQNEELHVQNEELIQNREIIEKQQNQLIQSEKMASMGQISAAVVHEINTPIGAIKSNAQLIEMMTQQLLKDDDVISIHNKIKRLEPANALIVSATDRVIQIIKSIKNFSRIDQSAFKEGDIEEAIESVLLLTSNIWKSRIKIHKTYGQIPLVNCYIGLINQVIMNLIVNAIDAIEGNGDITIKTGEMNDEVFVSISDTGCGMDEMTLKQIFIQGYTTKPIGKGSGLGLALSHDIMIKHQGRIEVKSDVGKGSEFTMYIPHNPDVLNV